MEGDPEEESGLITVEPDLMEGTWMTGQPLRHELVLPLEYGVDPAYPGRPPSLNSQLAAPVLSLSLLRVLQSAGVDNLQVFEAIVRDPGNGATYDDFRAVNVVGLVRAANMFESKVVPGSELTLLDVDFEALVVDEAKTRGLLLFRLAEAVNAIVVHEAVKQAVEDAGFEDVGFYGPGEWLG